MEARGQAGGPTVLAGHSPPPERLGPQHRLSQAVVFGGGEGRATKTRGRLWARFEGVHGRRAKLGQVRSVAVLAGHFPPPYCAQHGLPQAGEVDGGKVGGAAAKGWQLECVWLDAGPGRKVKRGLAGSPTVLVGRFPSPYFPYHNSSGALGRGFFIDSLNAVSNYA